MCHYFISIFDEKCVTTLYLGFIKKLIPLKFSFTFSEFLRFSIKKSTCSETFAQYCRFFNENFFHFYTYLLEAINKFPYSDSAVNARIKTSDRIES